MLQVHCRTGKAAVVAIAAAVPVFAASLVSAGSPPHEAPQDQAKVITVEKVVTPAPVQVQVQGKAQIQFLPPGLVNGLGVDVEQAVRNMVLRLGPILRVEMRYLTLAADPTPEQRREIAVEAGQTLKDYARTVSGGGQGNVAAPAPPGAANGVMVPAQQVMIKRVATTRGEPRKLIHDAIEAAAKAKLSPEQFTRYQAELDRKTRDRREAVLVNIVAKLDQLLSLGEDQRDKLQDVLRSHWDDRNFPTVESITQYEQYYPVIQDPLILPILTDGQQKIWRNAQKINFASVRNNNQFVGNQFVNDDDLARDADLKAALAPEVKP